MKVKVLRPFWFEGELRGTGAEVDLPDQLGREVVYGGKAERVIPPAKPASEPLPVQPAKQTMTTKTAGALAGKKGD